MSITTTVLLDVMDLSGVFCVDDTVLTQVFFKIPFYGILWGCTHVLCGFPTFTSKEASKRRAAPAKRRVAHIKKKRT